MDLPVQALLSDGFDNDLDSNVIADHPHAVHHLVERDAVNGTSQKEEGDNQGREPSLYVPVAVECCTGQCDNTFFGKNG